MDRLIDLSWLNAFYTRWIKSETNRCRIWTVDTALAWLSFKIGACLHHVLVYIINTFQPSTPWFVSHLHGLEQQQHGPETSTTRGYNISYRGRTPLLPDPPKTWDSSCRASDFSEHGISACTINHFEQWVNQLLSGADNHQIHVQDWPYRPNYSSGADEWALRLWYCNTMHQYCS